MRKEKTYLSSTSGLLCLSTSWQGKFCTKNRNMIGKWETKWIDRKRCGRTWRHIAAWSVLRMQVKYKRNVVPAWNERKKMEWVVNCEKCDEDLAVGSVSNHEYGFESDKSGKLFGNEWSESSLDKLKCGLREGGDPNESHLLPHLCVFQLF